MWVEKTFSSEIWYITKDFFPHFFLACLYRGPKKSLSAVLSRWNLKKRQISEMCLTFSWKWVAFGYAVTVVGFSAPNIIAVRNPTTWHDICAGRRSQAPIYEIEPDLAKRHLQGPARTIHKPRKMLPCWSRSWLLDYFLVAVAGKGEVPNYCSAWPFPLADSKSWRVNVRGHEGSMR